MMRKTIVSTLLIVLFFAAGCRSKKKVSNISRGYDIEYKEVKNDTKTEDVKVADETTKAKENVKETYDRKVVEETIFDSTGRPKSYTKTTEEKGNKDTTKDTETNRKDSTATNTATSGTEITGNESGTEDIANSEEPQKKRNPIWHWIGGALFLVIIGYAVWKIVLKR